MFKEFLIFIVRIILFFVFIMGLAIGLVYKIEQISCSAKSKAINYNYEYGWLQGCVIIKPDGKKVLLEQLRKFD